MTLSLVPKAVSCRRNTSGLLLVLVLGWPGAALVAHAEPVPLTLSDAIGRPMIGVVCDNLEGTDRAERNYLVVNNVSRLTSYKLLPANGNSSDALGEVRFELGRLRYYPPAEFDSPYEPNSAKTERAQNERRKVVLQVTGQDWKGRPLEGKTEIVLARPTVVLVHGINNGPQHWNGDDESGVGSELRRNGFTVAALNHGKDAYQELLQEAEKAGQEPVSEDFQKLFFRGNGPVEFAAGRLCEKVQDELRKLRRQRLAARRVDIVSHSYGGVIARWYLHSNALHSAAGRVGKGEEIGHASRLWYTNSNYPGGRDLYRLPVSFLDGSPFRSALAAQEPCPGDHTGSVRKLVTIASPWRGVPIANLVNEIHGPVEDAPDDAPEAVSLRRKRIGLKRLGWYVNKTIPVPVRVPAMEVLAVNSRWLAHLNARPFVDGIAYGAIAGNDNAYQLGIDLNRALDRILSPSWFVYLGLEHRGGAAINYSDGLIPVWSAVIDENSQVIPATHNKILSHPQAKRYVLEALSRRDLTRGAALNRRWAGNWEFSMPLSAGENPQTESAPAPVKTWQFKTGRMAPGDRDAVYVARATKDAQSPVARLSQQALREVRTVEVRYKGAARPRDGADKDSGHLVSISWTTTLPTMRPRVIFHGDSANEVEVDPPPANIKVMMPLAPHISTPTARTRHEILVRGLRLHTPYKFTVQSEIDSPPDRTVELSSRAQTFTLKLK